MEFLYNFLEVKMAVSGLDFALENNIISWDQDLSDPQIFYNRRDALFRALGVNPAFLTGKSILEFGPGGGDNAFHLLSWKPSRYVGVDGLKKALELAREKLSSLSLSGES